MAPALTPARPAPTIPTVARMLVISTVSVVFSTVVAVGAVLRLRRASEGAANSTNKIVKRRAVSATVGRPARGAWTQGAEHAMLFEVGELIPR